MHKDLKNIYYKAEAEYLTKLELKALNNHLSSFAKRLETYKFLRDQEIQIFQPVADKLLEAFPHVEEKILENSLKHWMTILRYAAWSMLINNPEYVKHRILEWLIDIIKSEEMHSIETVSYQLLNARLKELLSEEKIGLIEPFLSYSEHTLLQSRNQQIVVSMNSKK